MQVQSLVRALNASIPGTTNYVCLSVSLSSSLSLNSIENIFNVYGEKEKSRRGDHGKRGKQKNVSIRHREGKGRSTGEGKKGRKEKEEEETLTYMSEINSTHSVAKGLKKVNCTVSLRLKKCIIVYF